MKKFFALLFIIPMLSNAQNYSDHLTPDRGIWGISDSQFDYYSKVRKVLFNDLSDKPLIRLLVMPSFTPENVLDIQERESNYYLIYRIGESKIWSNNDWEKVKVKEYKCEIDSKSAELISSLFLIAIKQTKYYEEDIMGLDGVNYYFFAWDFGLKTGKVWTPQTPKMKRLVEIGNELIKLAKNNDTIVSFDKKLIEEIETLKRDLEQ